MTHLSEEQALAHAMGYGEAEAAGHAATCAVCQGEIAAWQRTLAVADETTVPEAPDPERLWQQIGPRLGEQQARKAVAWPAWALAAAACLAAVVFFLARPQSVAPPATPESVVASSQEASPVLRFAVAEHLDRAQALLVEMAHANELPGTAVNLSLEKSSARTLLNANRLYHQSARLQGDAMLAHVLSSLEPALTEIAHSSNELPASQWRQMQHRIAASGVLFKVRVLDQNLHAENGAL